MRYLYLENENARDVVAAKKLNGNEPHPASLNFPARLLQIMARRDSMDFSHKTESPPEPSLTPSEGGLKPIGQTQRMAQPSQLKVRHSETRMNSLP
ncbi:hypothetical protein NPIL_320151 [Nephila pilipes]|uniref:Uncharacterized protein n=1 Tax=Nephila pilipes TaxID=299642 RepID=A0A8X6THP9_NEPPI|nr:hypothetical protein NPIL_320151 [Nephila pilipes]